MILMCYYKMHFEDNIKILYFFQVFGPDNYFKIIYLSFLIFATC